MIIATSIVRAKRSIGGRRLLVFPMTWVWLPWSTSDPCPPGTTMAQFALRWILMADAVTCTIPGAKRPAQEQDNAAAADLPPLPNETMAQVQTVYERHIREHVYHYW